MTFDHAVRVALLVMIVLLIVAVGADVLDLLGFVNTNRCV
jgi:hypothetical protein